MKPLKIILLSFFVTLFSSISLGFSISKKNMDCPDYLNHDVRILDSKETENLCKYKDKVILAVNVASRCGFTYQYESLQNLFKDYQEKGLVVLGFPSRDFMYQEYNDESDVKEFCSTNYGVSFPLYATSKVKGENANPFYKDLSEKSGLEPSWNFTKYLISKDGKVTDVFSSKVEPNSAEVIGKLEALL